MIGREFDLSDGTVVWIDSYFVCRTYEGLEGDDCDPRGNLFVLNSVRHQLVKRIWPSIPVVLLRGDVFEENLAVPLPKIAVHAILRSSWRANESEDGSHLAVLWLQDEEWPLLSSDNLKSLQALSWKDFALDFCY